MIATLLTIQGSINLLQHGQSLIVHKEEQHSFAGSGDFMFFSTAKNSKKLSFYPSDVALGQIFQPSKLHPQSFRAFVPWLTMGATT